LKSFAILKSSLLFLSIRTSSFERQFLIAQHKTEHLLSLCYDFYAKRRSLSAGYRKNKKASLTVRMMELLASYKFSTE
jgi:hypothetical protein